MTHYHTPPPDNRFNKWIRLFLGLMLIWFFMDIFGILPYFKRPKVKMRLVEQPKGDLGDQERSTIKIFKMVSPSVFYITNKRLKRDLFSFSVMEVPQGTGSGFLWDDKGHIITNFHVIYKAHEVEVKLQDGRSYDAVLVGADPDHDLAVLRISTRNLNIQPVIIGDSGNLQVGQRVLAIGNPFGLDSTLTMGIISALGRTIQSMTERYIHDVIQTDAAINPGNSGGPLLDSFGRVIGINTSILSPSGSSAGIGFAVPIDTINRIVTQLINHGKVARPGLGVSLVPDNIMSRLGMKGVAILQVYRGSAAEISGLKGVIKTSDGDITIGDIIVECDNHPVSKGKDLIKALDRHKVGDEIELVFLRNNMRMQTNLVLQEID